MTPRQARGRFVTLTALRWLPVGLLAPVLVLLPQSRGISLAAVGALFALHSVIITVLELPTGGLADAIGRRPVLLLSGVVQLAAIALFAVAQSLWVFAVVVALKGVSRALDSGPLEAWYVDAARADDPDADISRGLSWSGIADGVALCLGAVVGGLLPTIATGEALLVPVLAAAGLQAVFVAAVALTMSEDRPAQDAGALRASLRQTPQVVAGAVRLAVRDTGLRLLLLVAAVLGLMLSTVEVLGPTFLVELAGDPARGARYWGFAIAAGFGAAAVGSALAPLVRRAAHDRPDVAATVLSVGMAAAMALLILAATPVAVAACIVGMYGLSGARNPLLREVLHSRVGPRQRATALSAESLALQAGGMGGSLALPALAATVGFGAAWGAVAGVLLGGAVLCAGLVRLPGGGPTRAGLSATAG